MKIKQRTSGGIGANSVFVLMLASALLIVLVGFAAFLLFYGAGWSDRFGKKIPLTTMNGVRIAVGEPKHYWTNTDGSITWDYTRWWSSSARVYFNSNGTVTRVFTD